MSATELSFKSDSEFIEEVTYHVRQKELVVRMKGGKVYRHPSVSYELFHQFADAESHGNFYNTEIKNMHPHMPSKAEIKRNEDAFILLEGMVREFGQAKRIINATTLINQAEEIINRKV